MQELPYRVILNNHVDDIHLHAASFLNMEDAHTWGSIEMQKAQWSNPRMWHSYYVLTIETTA